MKTEAEPAVERSSFIKLFEGKVPPPQKKKKIMSVSHINRFVINGIFLYCYFRLYFPDPRFPVTLQLLTVCTNNSHVSR